MIIRKFIFLGISVLSTAIATPAQAGPRVREINERENRQQHRIVEGIEDHELTPAEVNKLELREAEIKQQERKDELAHNGHLTKREQRRLKRELDLLSARIHKLRHNQ